MQPAARVVAILREPASFLRSLHLQFVQTMIETEPDLRKALALQERRREGHGLPRGTHVSQPFMYSEHVRYVEQLRRFRTALRARAGAGPDLRRLPRRQRGHRAADHGLPRRRRHRSRQAVEVNPTVQVRAGRLHAVKRAVHSAQGPAARGAKNAVNAVIPGELRRRVVRPLRRQLRRRVVFAEPAPPDEELMRELRRRFRGEVAALSEDLDRDLLSLWGYERGA